jgi:hypothetical protein
MSAPIQEPLTQRSIANLQWGNNQLFRRPDPNSAFVPPVFRAAQWATGTTTNGNDMELAIFDEWENPDESIFGGNLVGSDLGSVEGLVDGLYVITMTWYWDGLGYGLNVRHAGEIENNLGVGITEPNMCEMPRSMGGHGGGDPAYSFTIIDSYPGICQSLSLPGCSPVRPLPDYEFYVGQNSTTNKDAYVSVEVAYWPCDITVDTT